MYGENKVSNGINSALPVIAIMGPTASGKTGLALDIAAKVESEVISVDSALVYKGMDIGTAKPTQEEQAGVVHHLIDIIDPAQSYSVSQFVNDTNALIGDILARGKVPILAGGTMMYFNALINGISPLPKSDEKIRDEITQQAQRLGWSKLHDELRGVDPISGERIHPNDPQRITRALEVYRSTGKTLTHWQQQEGEKCPYNIAQFAIAPADRAVLHERIATRFDLMLEQGFENEVVKLYERSDLHEDLPSIRSVGYRQMWQYLDGQLSYAEMRERGIIATRQLAKRQLTWLRGWEQVTWLDTFANDNLTKITAKVTL
ncbi:MULTISPECIES: tRNA (adenosine(37)-N6)-dimethylallyltransferase MiaA [Alteromonas]|jgi:tRNA dimethylallyltransferase|nr:MULTISPECIES: tRNA (adenosine(37)-N6)-dimethylallyltransferase MiaA [Alteromonas]MCH2256184.1 tRNA (adenosine(37)-N6)-dimethylallyltransferase MiaA [Alteromonas sp.]MEC7133202.1 tRNA (adenosine(37)-N6)-dimethylallyltransferase MiaA [Pseudomonadota bacterium]AMN13366.1 tRNA dimethylallyltransferase [Alteromonas macleodii]AUI84123.1 tRNA (adenosine(37)-N6)-dimethylallyltransferase MiaA [Alteromonas macleodii]MBL3812341.1 tRNA (adenosine(37)-N6)-dimethylallyltransferase MiaA [Alteromonas macle|tara:strand:+ start:57 stop:1010 length:954 start_codon:yes stop_codon:yes gene_type:complete|eukprot:TRINITY_DN33635_c0_g1_i1.p1 TRINITY_DN33635_c0_g1~~TRINITY_DN33635_c0_g1_i1.p1  ORF type:complete len:318 (-),score=11.48 TRINITY_DN33635_c0_g1_i1:500-1453(-)